MPRERVRSIVVDDHALFRNGLVSQVQQFDNVPLVAEARRSTGSVSRIGDRTLKVELMDPGMQGMSGPEAAQAVPARQPLRTILEKLDLRHGRQAAATAAQEGVAGPAAPGPECTEN